MVEKKKGLLSRILGNKDKGCCDVIIEEVNEPEGAEESEAPEKTGEKPKG